MGSGMKILKIKVPIFPIDGEILKQKGMQEGQSLGNVLKTLEKEWINNNFKISNERIEDIIKLNSNLLNLIHLATRRCKALSFDIYLH